MRVALHVRERRAGNYSIEQIFEAVRGELSATVDIATHVMRKKFDLAPLLAMRREVNTVHHVTGDIHYAALLLPGKKTVLTIHDLGSFTNDPPGLKRLVYRKLWYDWPCRRVAKVTTISEFSKRCIVETLGLNASDVRVIFDPLLPGFSWMPRQENRVPVILQIGSIHNKNVGRLVEAVRGLRVKLLLINRLDDPEVTAKLAHYNIDYVQRVGLSRSELAQAYAEADLVYFASTYEGFGMPIIEAQAIGRPVITSTVTAMPEIAGSNHKLLVNPWSVEEIRTAILRAIEDRRLRDHVVADGLENVKRFKIENIAREYLDVYNTLERDGMAEGNGRDA